MADAPIAFVDVTVGPPRYDLLDGFVALYDAAFTDPSEREDPIEWSRRLWQVEPHSPSTRLITAVESGSPIPRVIGGLMFEYYQSSRCGLLTYLVVELERRRRGIGRELVDRATATLHEIAASNEAVMEGVFAETEDPSKVIRAAGQIDPFDRLRVFSSLGARWVDIPYIQPALAPGGVPCRHLLLVALPLHPGQTLPYHIRGASLLSFLADVYACLGVEPERDPDFNLMHARIGADVRLRDLAEKRSHA